MGMLPTPGSAQAMTAMQHILRTNGGTGIIDFFEVAGLSDRDFVTQARNAELVAACDRYLVL